jgi:hypothetical protein
MCRLSCGNTASVSCTVMATAPILPTALLRERTLRHSTVVKTLTVEGHKWLDEQPDHTATGVDAHRVDGVVDPQRVEQPRDTVEREGGQDPGEIRRPRIPVGESAKTEQHLIRTQRERRAPERLEQTPLRTAKHKPPSFLHVGNRSRSHLRRHATPFRALYRCGATRTLANERNTLSRP